MKLRLDHSFQRVGELIKIEKVLTKLYGKIKV